MSLRQPKQRENPLSAGDGHPVLTRQARKGRNHMRKTVIYCDKCGAEIVGTPIQIIPEYSDRGGSSREPYLGDEEELPLWIRRMLDKEFCERCAKKVLSFALSNVGANEKEPDKEESKPGSDDLDYSEAISRISVEKKKEMRVFRDGIRVNSRNIWSDELFPYIGCMVNVEIAHRLITVKDGEKVLFMRDLPE